MSDAKPMSPERLAAIELLLRLPARDASDGLRQGMSELLAEVRRLQSALDLSARHTPFSSEPCPLCLHAGETCAMHRHIDSLGESLIARTSERDVARSRLDISESHVRDKDARIVALETGLREACGIIEGWVQSESQYDSNEDDPDWKVAQRLRALADNTKET